MGHTALSLILCSRNRASSLSRCLDSIPVDDMSRHRAELILVDSASTDRTGRLMEEYRRKVPFPVRVIRADRAGLGYARRLAVESAEGDILVFTDDDCYLGEKYIERALDAFSRDRFQFCGGRILLYDESDAPIGCSTGDRLEIIPPGSFIPAGRIQGANMIFRREAIERIGSFDGRIGAGTPFRFEDVDLAARASFAGFTGAYVPELVVYHHHGRKPGAGLRSLRRANDRARGAYYLKMILVGNRVYVRRWIRSLLRTRRVGRSLREVAGGAWYAIHRLFWGRRPER
jgi:GT2 family glycosyltransferase